MVASGYAVITYAVKTAIFGAMADDAFAAVVVVDEVAHRWESRAFLGVDVGTVWMDGCTNGSV